MYNIHSHVCWSDTCLWENYFVQCILIKQCIISVDVFSADKGSWKMQYQLWMKETVVRNSFNTTNLYFLLSTQWGKIVFFSCNIGRVKNAIICLDRHRMGIRVVFNWMSWVTRNFVTGKENPAIYSTSQTQNQNQSSLGTRIFPRFLSFHWFVVFAVRLWLGLVFTLPGFGFTILKWQPLYLFSDIFTVC